MALLLPLFSFLVGYWGVEYLKRYRAAFAMLLARLLIPIIIVYNMVFYQQGSIWLIVFSFFTSVLLYSVYFFYRDEPVGALCFSYLNGAWLGFPFALALFGPQASAIIVALYIGGSIFGNICAVLALQSEKCQWSQIAKKVISAPPMVALIIAGALSFWDFSAWQQHVWGNALYQLNKVLVTFTGMCVLGMWLSQVRIDFTQVLDSFRVLLIRVSLGILCCGLAYLLLPIPHQILIYAVMLMYLMLPPAANIVALETHYRGTGTSAPTIAAGTIASVIFIALYAVFLHAVFGQIP